MKMKFVLVFAILAFFIGIYVGMQKTTTTINVYNYTKPVEFVKYEPVKFENSSFSYIHIPAVDEDGNGLMTTLSVQVVPGTGRILVNIDKLFFWTDTQASIRTSRSVAANITGINLSNYDIIYTIETNATAVEGPSAGAALTIATIAALQHKQINQSVAITGTINHDGTIGPVGNVMEKAKAAKESGAELFLVPLLQSKETTYETYRYCEKIGVAEICTTERRPKKIDISEEAKIKTIEVENIQEALKYFLID
jgi:uncharacterized protein